MTPRTWRASAFACAAALALIAVAPVMGQKAPDRDSLMAEKTYYHPDLYIGSMWARATDLPVSLVAKTNEDLAKIGVAPANAYMDHRTGRWGTLIPTTALIPGNGVGNHLQWEGLQMEAPKSDAELRAAVGQALRDYIRDNESVLKISVDELAFPGRMAINGDLIQIWIPRVIDGVHVRKSYLNAVVNHGNLILFGARNWNEVSVATTPSIDFDEAGVRAQQHLSGISSNGFWRKPSLTLVPVAQGNFLPEIPMGAGLGYRLAWAVAPEVAGDQGRWEALVDAHSGEVLQFEDTVQYQTARSISGGVLPRSNDGMDPDGVEQAGWPMPYADGFLLDGTEVTADAGGNLPICVDGAVGTTLSGRYMQMTDNCGAIEEFSTGDLDLGTNPGTNCSTPAGSNSAGNTRSSRSGFFEMNQMMAQARGYLEDNSWVRSQLNANMNINNVCNATWDGASVNFFQSGSGCGNTGEIAGVFDHEWGHGMDNNDVNPTISNPGEGIADIYASLRLHDSCMGRGFFQSGNCSGYGDPCIDCSGVRDVDWEQRASGEPHDIEFIAQTCGIGPAPCGGGVHCEGSVYAESVWDLAARTLPAAPFNLDQNSAFELAARMTYLGSGAVGAWYNCDNFSETGDGCNADGGYLNYLAADDDNGSLTDGTPHMSAVFAAFNIHGIACDTPIVQNADCSAPAAPSVTGTGIDRGAVLSWDAVPGAEGYVVYRTDGEYGCNYGNTTVGTTSDLSFVDDEGIQNGREYYYSVAAIGASPSCTSPLSSCTTVTPENGPNIAIDDSSNVLTIDTGDGDEFLDNCEMATFEFDVFSIGTGNVTDVTVLDVRSPSHPLDITTNFPMEIAGSLSACDTATASIEFTGNGLGFDDTVELEVDVTAAELNGVVRTATFTIQATESNFQNFASRTFTFEDDREAWTTIQGTYDRTDVGGGANGSSFYMASSADLEFQCDQVTSPVVRLNANSTLSAWNNFDIEPTFGGGVWYDRANFGILEENGDRTSVDPDGGRGHDATGENGTCDTANEDGFAGLQPTWAESTYSATALNSADFAGDLVRLSVYYGTDPLEHGYGYWFDDVTLTNFDMQVEDGQPNDCGLVNPTLNLTGSCPGAMTVTVTGLTPNGGVSIGIGSDMSGTVLPNGPCAGQEIELGGIQTRRDLTADANGAVTFSATPGAGICNGLIQAVDASTCTTSSVEMVP